MTYQIQEPAMQEYYDKQLARIKEVKETHVRRRQRHPDLNSAFNVQRPNADGEDQMVALFTFDGSIEDMVELAGITVAGTSPSRFYVVREIYYTGSENHPDTGEEWTAEERYDYFMAHRDSDVVREAILMYFFSPTEYFQVVQCFRIMPDDPKIVIWGELIGPSETGNAVDVVGEFLKGAWESSDIMDLIDQEPNAQNYTESERRHTIDALCWRELTKTGNIISGGMSMNHDPERRRIFRSLGQLGDGHKSKGLVSGDLRGSEQLLHE